MKPPYYAVIFTNLQTNNTEGYTAMAEKMEHLAKQQPGFLGMESARDHLGITVSYWKTTAAIKQWKQNLDHLEAQQKGRSLWYSWYRTRICLVERDYEFTAS
ncbi:antibiotic biosynthesis monooxygenase family protein [Constantimarinum furrinae]|uniref:ABM domain-containing protein n=1 Tax=Constantimarinum furrinae TaxID=2562285 RepID=A0A7G8PTC2_9FLAO|nr:antibiotic biosynthesis monooxygenase [Constantimarinum furrinae]QNJ97588.1 hypothetical protein ALE3EI_1015 [Constantimarinum furrinae]